MWTTRKEQEDIKRRRNYVNKSKYILDIIKSMKKEETLSNCLEN